MILRIFYLALFFERPINIHGIREYFSDLQSKSYLRGPWGDSNPGDVESFP